MTKELENLMYTLSGARHTLERLENNYDDSDRPITLIEYTILLDVVVKLAQHILRKEGGFSFYDDPKNYTRIKNDK